jgi:hypothetical protein
VDGNARGPTYTTTYIECGISRSAGAFESRMRLSPLRRDAQNPHSSVVRRAGRYREMPWTGQTGAHTNLAGRRLVTWVGEKPHTPTTTTWGRCSSSEGREGWRGRARVVPPPFPTLGSSPSKRQAQLTALSALQNAASPSTKTS